MLLKRETRYLRLNDQVAVVVAPMRQARASSMAVVLVVVDLVHLGLFLLAVLVVQPLLLEQERQDRSMGLLALAVAVVALLLTLLVERVALDMLAAVVAVVVAYTDQAAATQLALVALVALAICSSSQCKEKQ